MNISIGNILREARNRHGYSLKEVASIIGRSDKAVSSWETGRTQPDVTTFIKLCDIYNIDSLKIFVIDDTEYLTDLDKQRLYDNYDKLNVTGKQKLVAYSDDLIANPANI